jgi:hypothetical protein
MGRDLEPVLYQLGSVVFRLPLPYLKLIASLDLEAKVLWLGIDSLR